MKRLASQGATNWAWGLVTREAERDIISGKPGQADIKQIIGRLWMP